VNAFDPPGSSPDDSPPVDVLPPPPAWIIPPPRRRFQHRYRTHLILFALTLFTTTWSGSCHYQGFQISQGIPTELSVFAWPYLVQGLWYSLPLLLILGAHEFGHYAYCRIHQVDATLPYFIPAPVPLTGTLGAVIRIREAFPSKRALFDIGVAGPIAGFLVLLPILYIGVGMSEVVRFPENPSDVIYFGEPLLLKAVAWWHFGTLPQGADLTLHPMGFAAWWGLLATAINLLPFGQLDGGHIAYSVLGRRASIVSAATLGVAVLLTFRSTSWLAMTLILATMAFVLGVRHPKVVDEHVPLDPGRLGVALFAVLMFVVCFTPVPVEMFVAQN